MIKKSHVSLVHIDAILEVITSGQSSSNGQMFLPYRNYLAPGHLNHLFFRAGLTGLLKDFCYFRGSVLPFTFCITYLIFIAIILVYSSNNTISKTVTSKNHIRSSNSRPTKFAKNWTLIVFEVAPTSKSNPKQCIGGQRGTLWCPTKFFLSGLQGILGVWALSRVAR